MAKPETKRSRRGCTACRARHLKCDEVSPVCQRCRENGRECEQAPLISQWRKPKRMRKASTPPSEADKQSWVHIPPKLTFVVDSVIDDADTQPPSEPQLQSQSQSVPRELPDLSILGHGEPSPPSSAEDDSSLSQFGASVAFSVEAMDWSTITTSFLDLQSLDCLASFDNSSYLPSATSDDHVRKLRQIADSNVHEPTRATVHLAPRDTSNIGNDKGSGGSSYDGLSLVRDRTEAHLLRHYRQTLAPLFDVTDANRHFQLEVTKRASTCEVLLNAIFALAALHLSRTCSFDASMADKYHSRCDSMLDALLSSDQPVVDENLLVTVVVLRKYEEMNLTTTGKDLERHLAKSAALFNSPTRELGGGLGQTAFWQFVRQDVYLSLLKRALPRTDISNQPPLTIEAGAPDCVWANRIVWITVCILAYCFAEQPQDAVVWHDLDEKITQWGREKPSTFDPIYFREPSPEGGCFFPEIWLSDPWHGEWQILAAIPLWTSPSDSTEDLATGMQYYHISRLLLALYNPNVARASAGLDYPRAHWQMQRSVLYHARSVCGIASSNDFVTTRFTLCAVMQSCGGWFTESLEQAAITRLLSTAEKENGWPTTSVVESLRETWSLIASEG